jgi:hypothetical protein
VAANVFAANVYQQDELRSVKRVIRSFAALKGSAANVMDIRSFAALKKIRRLQKFGGRN